MTDTIRTSIMELLRLNERQVAMIDRLRTTEGRKSLAADRQRYASTLRALRDRGFSYYDPQSGSPYLTPRGEEVVKLLNLVPPTATAPAAAPVAFDGTVAGAVAVISAALGIQPPPPPAPPGARDVFIGDEAALSTLVTADRDLTTRVVERAQYVAFKEVLAALDGWVEGARDNHEGLDHGAENTGEECWKTFHIEDIRNMVADTARLLGVREVLDAAS